MHVHYLIAEHGSVTIWNRDTPNIRETVPGHDWKVMQGPMRRLGVTLYQVYREPKPFA